MFRKRRHLLYQLSVTYCTVESVNVYILIVLPHLNM
jgi:hypothetical protein